ncbi:MAG: hypothetical protein OHK0013_38080 [Sandaracinaceae bacterium]
MLRSVLVTALFVSMASSLALGACGGTEETNGAGTGGQDAELSTGTTVLACDDEPCSPSQLCVDCGGGEGSFQCELTEVDDGFFLCGTLSCLNDLDACIASATATDCRSYLCEPRPECPSGDPCDCLPEGCTDCQVDANGQVTYGCG